MSNLHFIQPIKVAIVITRTTLTVATGHRLLATEEAGHELIVTKEVGHELTVTMEEGHELVSVEVMDKDLMIYVGVDPGFCKGSS